MSEKKKVEGKNIEGGKKKEKKGGKWKLALVFCLLIAVVAVGGFFLYKYLKREQVTTETVKIEADSKEFSGYFKTYLSDRLAFERLTEYGFREMSTEEILDELSDIKDGFSKASKGVDSYKGSEFEGIAEIINNDVAVFTKTIRELRWIESGNYTDEADRQLDFMKASTADEESLRSALCLARGALGSESEGINGEAILIFEGDVMVEVGGGVMNILVGDLEQNVTAIGANDLNGIIRRINSDKLFGLYEGELIQIGKGLREEVETGKLTEIKVEKKQGEAEVITTRIPVIGESTWGLKTRLNEEGIKGLIEVGGGDIEKNLNETIDLLSGKVVVDK